MRIVRQAVVLGYVVDFCCRSLKLVIEIDGGAYDRSAHADVHRDRVMTRAGDRIVRLPADLVTYPRAELIETLRNVIEAPLLPKSGEGAGG